jgi:hypothetical protein
MYLFNFPTNLMVDINLPALQMGKLRPREAGELLESAYWEKTQRRMDPRSI